MNPPKISIIVPVYKVEKYLPECIDSILAQTYTDFELLLIDDGSPDNSGQICDEYASRDPRIRVFHKENGGVSSARNFGIERAKGEWITFVDGDDYLKRNYLDAFRFNKEKADLYLQGYINLINGEIESGSSFSENYTTENLLKVFIEGEKKKLLNSPVCKIFSTAIIRQNNIQFDHNTSYGEDHIFVLDYINHCSSALVAIDQGYIYNHHENSLTTRNIPYKEILYYSNTIREKQLQFVNKNKYDYPKAYSDIEETYLLNIIKVVMGYFSDRNLKHNIDVYDQIISQVNSTYGVKESLFLKFFKFGFNFNSHISYLYHKILTTIFNFTH